MAALKAMASLSQFLPLGADNGSLDGHIFFMVQSWISINQITNSVTAGLNIFGKVWQILCFLKINKKPVMGVFVVESLRHLYL